MSGKVDLNTKFRITPQAAAFALSISLEKFYMLLNENVITSRGGKVLKSEVEEVLNMVYSPAFPKNINNDKKRDALMNAFCKPREIMILKTSKGV